MLWFQWHLPFSFLGLSLCVSALLRTLFAPPRSGKCSSNHSPAFSSMTGAHPLSDLAGSQMLPDFPRLAPHAPVLKSSVTKLLGLLKSDYPREADHSFRHSVLSARLNLLTWPWLRAPPHVSPALQFIPGYLVLSGAARSQSLIWADPDNCYLSSLCLEEIFQITNGTYHIAQKTLLSDLW